MNKLISSILCITVISINLHAETPDSTKTKNYSMTDYKNKTFIFDANQQITECNAIGIVNSPKSTVTAYQGSRFNVVHVDKKTGELTIRFLIWSLPKKIPTDSIKFKNYQLALKNRSTFNVKTQPEKVVNLKSTQNAYIRYFLLSQDDMATSCSEYVNGANWVINFGTFTSPFKFRPSKSTWTNNLNLGTAVSIEYKLSKNWSLGSVVGLSLSSITLDSASTFGHVKTNTERPALTPSFSLLASYKNINFTFGSGIDYINRPSLVEQSWIFNGKPWIGFGIGVNLFSNSKPANNTVPIN